MRGQEKERGKFIEDLYCVEKVKGQRLLEKYGKVIIDNCRCQVMDDVYGVEQ